MKIKENARIACLGDSITHWGHWVYDVCGYLSSQKSGIKFYNCGISGNLVSNVPYSLEDDVLWLKPDYVLVMFGANDVGQDLYRKSVWTKQFSEEERGKEIEKKFEKYAKYMRMTCELIINRGAEPILMTAPPFDSYEREGNEIEIMEGINEEMARYADEVRKVASEFGLQIVEIYPQMVEAMENIRGINLYCEDRIHPSREGMSVIAAIILNSMGFDIEVPKSVEEFNALPFVSTPENDARFETDHILRECAMIDWLHFKDKNEVMFYEDKIEGLIRQCQELTDDMPDWWKIWIKSIAVDYAKNRGKREELRRILIEKTESL